MNKKIIIKIADDFSAVPGARYRTDGKFSGQEFYEEILLIKIKEALESNSKVLLDLDGTWGLASSFISEVFTRLKKDFPDTEKILETLEFKSDEEPLFIDKIKNTIRDTQ